MISYKNPARVAGLLYLFVLILPILVGVSRLSLITDDPATTANNIVASEWLFRIGVVSDIGHVMCLLLLAWVLYGLFKSVNKNVALLFLLCISISVAIQCINMINYFVALHVLSGAEYLTVFEEDQLHALAMFYLVDMQTHGIFIAQIFFGFWLLPLGYLVYKSGYLPRILGILLMIGCFGYLIHVFQYFLLPSYEVISYPGLAVATISEVSFLGWLLLKGVKMPSMDEDEESKERRL